MRKIRGVSMPHMKNTAKYVPEMIPMPNYVQLPMSMHRGLVFQNSPNLGAFSRPIIPRHD